MKKIYIFLGFLVLLFTVALTRSWQTNKWETLFKNPLPKLESIKQEAGNYQEFITQDGKFKIKYPADWFLIKDAEILEATAPEKWQAKHDFRILLLAQRFQTEKFAQLIISEGSFDIKIEEIIEEMKKINQEQGWRVEIVKSDIEEKEGVFEARYLIPNNPALYSKEKILSGEKAEDKTKIYLIAFVALEKDWQEYSEQADFLLNSFLFLF